MRLRAHPSVANPAVTVGAPEISRLDDWPAPPRGFRRAGGVAAGGNRLDQFALLRLRLEDDAHAEHAEALGDPNGFEGPVPDEEGMKWL